LVSSFAVDVKGISRFNSCISAPLWIGLFIYLFLRKILPGMAKRFSKSFPPTTDHADHTMALAAMRFSEELRISKPPPDGPLAGR
jgi:hypothetical protein